MTILVAVLFIIAGAIGALAGYKLFRIVLPILGLFAGFAVGFTGVQAVFGSDVFSSVVAVITGVIVALIFAALSYFYFVVGMVLLGAAVGAGLLAALGHGLGLDEEGFVIFLLALAGAIIGGLLVFNYGLEKDIVILVSSFAGVALIFVGAFLAFGDLSLDELHDDGVRQNFRDTVDSSWVWLLAWLGGSLIASRIQYTTSRLEFFDDAFVISDEV